MIIWLATKCDSQRFAECCHKASDAGRKKQKFHILLHIIGRREKTLLPLLLVVQSVYNCHALILRLIQGCCHYMFAGRTNTDLNHELQARGLGI